MTREQLEQEAERNRAAVAGTLDELNQRLTPGELVDEVLSYMKGGGNEFLSNLGRQVTENPMPVTLIGAGLAWFLFVKSSSPNGVVRANYAGTAGPLPNRSGNGIGETAKDAADKFGNMASSATESINDAYHSVEDAASNAYHQAADKAANTYQQTADKLAMAKNSAIEMEQKAAAAGRSAIAFCQDQPLVLVGLGLALGATMGAALPGTEIEDRLMGETSDQLKENATDLAVEKLDKAKEYGAKVGEKLTEDVQSASAGGSVPYDPFGSPGERFGKTAPN